MAKRIIYDVGANNGDDIPYYLQKADLVVAIEPNPALVSEMKARFASDIFSGRLVIEPCVVTERGAADIVPFYISKGESVHSQFGEPPPQLMDMFEKVDLPARSLFGIILEHGAPFYVKVDIEGNESGLLGDLFKGGIVPEFLSAEVHTIAPFAAMVASGNYSKYKLVDGRSVCEVYKNCRVQGNNGEFVHSFPWHSAGPFGNDINGPWHSADEFFYLLAQERLGWKDVHAWIG